MSISRKIGSLTQLNVLVKIVEAGSLSQAARELNLTPSAVSKNLSQLEDQLGTVLLKRTTRNISLTDNGRIILERAESILEEIDNAFEISQSFQKPEGTLRLTCSVALGYSKIYHLVSEYQKAWPDVKVSVNLDDRITNLNEEDFDIALRITSNNEWTYSTDCIGEIQWFYCASPDYLATCDPITTPYDLTKHQCLVYPAMTYSGKWVFKSACDEIIVDIVPSIACNSSLFLLKCALSGKGVVCLPNYLANEQLKNSKLINILPEYNALIQHKLYALSIKSRHRNPMVITFLDFLKKNLTL